MGKAGEGAASPLPRRRARLKGKCFKVGMCFEAGRGEGIGWGRERVAFSPLPKEGGPGQENKAGGMEANAAASTDGRLKRGAERNQEHKAQGMCAREES